MMPQAQAATSRKLMTTVGARSRRERRRAIKMNRPHASSLCVFPGPLCPIRRHGVSRRAIGRQGQESGSDRAAIRVDVNRPDGLSNEQPLLGSEGTSKTAHAVLGKDVVQKPG